MYLNYMTDEGGEDFCYYTLKTLYPDTPSRSFTLKPYQRPENHTVQQLVRRSKTIILTN